MSFFPILAIAEVKAKLSSVKHKILVLSGKGGVGKSTFTAHLAHGLAADSEKQVGISTFLRDLTIPHLDLSQFTL